MAFQFAAEEAGFAGDEADHYQKIIDILISGGYFRARLPNLSPFDKVSECKFSYEPLSCFPFIYVDFGQHGMVHHWRAIRHRHRVR